MYERLIFASWRLKKRQDLFTNVQALKKHHCWFGLFWWQKGQWAVSVIIIASVHHFSSHRCVPDKSSGKFF